MQPITKYIREELSKIADPIKAPQMQAYMKTEQPFYGVQSKQCKQVRQDALKKYPIENREQWETVILELWNGTYREEMYQALKIAERYKIYHDEQSWELFERLLTIVQQIGIQLIGIAPNLIGKLVQNHRHFEKNIWEWTDDENFWVRRASLLAHLKTQRKN